MKAIIVSEYGSEEVMQVVDRSVPEVKGYEMLVKVMASSLSPVDIAFRTGKPYLSRLFTGLKKPKHEIPGDIVAGVVEKVGGQVTLFKSGDRIFGHAGLNFGAQGEYVALKEDEALVHMPDEMSFDDAAAFAYSGMTALPFMEDHYEMTPASRVLINGASGGIGTFAIQFAKLHGAHVTAVCSEDNFDLVKSIGADDVLDYKKNDFTAMNHTFDFIFDVFGKGAFSKARNVLNSGGIYLSTFPTPELMLRTAFNLKSQGRRGKFIATGLRKNDQKIKDLKRLSELFSKGRLKAVIDRVFTMDEIVEAHRFVEHGHKRGNTILKIG